MLMDRILGVFKLSVPTFEEIEHDTNATGQAALVVLLVAVLSAFGSGFASRFTGTNFISPFMGTLTWTLIGWFLVSIIVYFVGTSFMGGQATLQEMLRVMGFAYAPQLLGIIPCIGGPIGWVWSMAAGFVAVRQGLDLDNGKAALTILIAFGVYILGAVVVSIILGGINTIF